MKKTSAKIIKWTGKNMIEIDKFFGNNENTYHKNGNLIIKTSKKDIKIKKGTYIVKKNK
jgi:hypothetical protein